ncbi:hypothetical protein [Ancylobacter sp. IITR112]|uniref:hypothetical protein n=1 Tax=Ancylobacter sp. IITR112 TaxID=3138073 RepID=UPI00352B4635
MLGTGNAIGQTALYAGWRHGGGVDWQAWAAGLTAAQLLDIDYTKTDRHWQNVTGQTLADDAGEPIALAMDSGSWGGRSLADEVAAQPELKGTGMVGIVGSTTAATYNTATGAGSVARSSFPANQSYVAFPVVAGAYYEIDIEVGSILGLPIRPTTSGVAIIQPSSSGGRVKYRIASTSTELVLTAGADTTVSFTVHSLKRVPGNHSTQTTGASQPARQAGGVARFDGTADNLLTSFLAQAGAMTLVYKGTVPATLAAVQALMGSSGSSANRCWLGVNTSGRLCAGVGSQTESTIVGTTDVRGKTIVAALTFDGSTVSLFLRLDGATTEEYSAAQASTPTTSVPFRLGAMNSNGAAGAYAAIDASSFKAAHKVMTYAQFMSIAARL